ncbi:hypothetical protein B0H13DRAFT_2316713 [Mycena leptocephala]|nr:hypothetical protein B0H13DRAFT_2316713 [Mycena leptocephala]
MDNEVAAAVQRATMEIELCFKNYLPYDEVELTRNNGALGSRFYSTPTEIRRAKEGFPDEDETLQKRLNVFFQQYGATNEVLMRRNEDKKFKVYKAHNQKMKRFHTHSEAVAFWDEWCLRLHEDHSAPRYKVKGLKGEFATYDEALAAAASKYIFPA